MAIKLNIKPTIEILAERGLNGRAELFLANEVLRTTDPYVPMRTGTLKNTARIVQTAQTTEIVYSTPYARRQYYEGRSPGASSAGPLRGREWFERSKADHKEAWAKEVAKFTGGHTK